MVSEIKLKYYNEDLKIGFNSPREAAYNVATRQWLQSDVHAGRLVFGKNRVPYRRIVGGITHRDFVAQHYCPF